MRGLLVMVSWTPLLRLWSWQAAQPLHSGYETRFQQHWAHRACYFSCQALMKPSTVRTAILDFEWFQCWAYRNRCFSFVIFTNAKFWRALGSYFMNNLFHSTRFANVGQDILISRVCFANVCLFVYHLGTIQVLHTLFLDSCMSLCSRLPSTPMSLHLTRHK